VFQPSYLPSPEADTAMCRRCDTLIWVAASPLPTVFGKHGPTWRDKYGTICNDGRVGHTPQAHAAVRPAEDCLSKEMR
jgi:hypothetical protein